MQAPVALAFAAGGGLLVAFGFSLAWVLQRSQGPAVVAGPLADPRGGTPATAPQAALFDKDLPLDAAAREAALDRAASAVADGRTEEARAAYEDALRADPTAPRALAGLGTLAMQQRDWTTASECYGKLIELDETYRRQFGAMYARARKLAASRP